MTRPTIVKVHVGQRFTVGETIYIVDRGYVEEVVVLSKPYWAPYCPIGGHVHGAWRIRILDEHEVIRTPSLGDMGINGYRYDGRPSKMARTALLARTALASYNQWEDAQNQRYL